MFSSVQYLNDGGRNEKSFVSSVFSLSLIWSMKTGVDVTLCCFISPPESYVVQVNGDTQAFKHVHALLEFAPVGDLHSGDSSSVLRVFQMERMTQTECKCAHSICEVVLTCFGYCPFRIMRKRPSLWFGNCLCRHTFLLLRTLISKLQFRQTHFTQKMFFP